MPRLLSVFILLGSLTAMPAAGQLNCAVFGNIVSCYPKYTSNTEVNGMADVIILTGV